MLKLENNYILYNGDCLEVMDELIENGVKVDMILTDPPFGITNCEWDTIINFEEMWKRLNNLIKPNGAIVLFSSMPFSASLVSSNLIGYKYELIWDKTFGRQPQLANVQPMKQHESINIFSLKGKKINYYPQKEKLKKPYKSNGAGNETSSNDHGLGLKKQAKVYTHKTPTTILKFKPVANGKNMHPTEKPVALLEYLIKTYTLEGQVVLDFTAGSFSTAEACANTHRKFIGIELSESYFIQGEERARKAFEAKGVNYE